MFRRMKMSLHLHIVAPFRDGLIELVDITSGMIPCMIRVMQILFPTGFPPSHPSP
jgi:hypothetical protein